MIRTLTKEQGKKDEKLSIINQSNQLYIFLYFLYAQNNQPNLYKSSWFANSESSSIKLRYQNFSQLMASSAFQLRAVPFLLALSLGFSTCRSIPTDGSKSLFLLKLICISTVSNPQFFFHKDADENPSDPSDLAERAMSCFLDHNVSIIN